MGIDYRENLPERCPPEDAEEVREELHLYRLVESNPASDDDFRSQRAMYPDKRFHIDECLAHGLSVWTSQTQAENVRRLPKLRDKQVCRVRLCPGAGRIKQTFKPEHRTWWPFRQFDILAHCELVTL